MERRGPGRTRFMIPANVISADGSEFRCVLRDVSSTWAKIGMSAEHRLPQRFRLVTQDRPQGYPVRLLWRRGAYAGLTLDLPVEA